MRTCLAVGFGLWLAAGGVVKAADVQVEGIVLDGNTRAPIENSEIRSNEHRVLSNQDGTFSFGLPPGAWTLEVTHPDYLDSTVTIDVSEEGFPGLEILLLPPPRYMETVEVRASLPRPESPSSNPVAPREVFEVAGSIDNIYRTLDTLPGVAATEDFGSRLSVRGGSPDQNLTIMDGVEIHNPYRLFGITSAFNPETVENFELTAGGFSAKYGDRLSSLLVVDNRMGTEDFNGVTAASITDANIVLEGATPGRAKGNWLLTARRTYFDLIVGRIQDENYPSFADLQLKASWEFGPGHRLSVLGLTSREDSDFSIVDDDRPNETGTLVSDSKNDLLSTRLDALLGNRAVSTTVLSWYRNRERLDFNGTFRAEGRRSNAPDDEVAFGLSDILFDRELPIRDLSLRQELTVEGSPRHLLDAGFELHRLQTGIRFFSEGDRNQQEANGSSVRGGAGLPDELDSILDGTRGGVWLQDRFTASSRWTLEPGLRVDWSSINARTTVSPRLATSFDIGNGLRLQGAVGLFTQSPGYEKLLQSDYFVDLSQASELGIEHERAWHGIFGFEKDLGPEALFRMEAYYKRFDRRIVGRLETEEELRARLSRYDFPEELQGSIPTDRIITSFPTNDGRGTTYGLDFYLTLRDPSARLAGWLSYTWGKSEQEAYDRIYAFDYDRRHAFNLVGRYRVNNRFDIAVTARLASGFPWTPPLGLRVAAVEDERGMLVPELDGEGNLVYTTDLAGVENLNSGRLPFYARFDIRATYRPGGLTGRWSIYFELINAFDRDNAVALENQLEYDPTSLTPRLVEVPSEAFPRIPTFGVRFRF